MFLFGIVVVQVQSWLDTVGEAYIGKRELGDSLDSAYSLQEECLGIESQFLVGKISPFV